MSLWHLHRWTDWSITDRGEVTWHGSVVGWYLSQERYCLKCGKTQVSDKISYGNAPRSFCHRRSTVPHKRPRKDGVHA